MRTPWGWWRARQRRQQAEAHRALVQGCVMTPDEVRTNLGLPPQNANDAASPQPDGWLVWEGDGPPPFTIAEFDGLVAHKLATGHDEAVAEDLWERPEEGQEIRFVYRTPSGKEAPCFGVYRGGGIWSRHADLLLTRKWDRVVWWYDAQEWEDLVQMVDDEIVRQLAVMVRDHPAVVAALEETR